MAYIDREIAIKTAVENYKCNNHIDAVNLVEAMENIPSADVVEVVCCGKCKDFEPHGNGKGGICRNRKCKGLRYATDFCSYGERKDS